MNAYAVLWRLEDGEIRFAGVYAEERSAMAQIASCLARKPESHPLIQHCLIGIDLHTYGGDGKFQFKVHASV